MMMGFGLLVPIVVVVVLAYVFGWLPQSHEERLPRQKRKRDTFTALDILQERYARGEISEAEYLEMRDNLSQ
jgi:uncharacterized membrane protein